jgi:streptomycin 6-kinase
MQYFFGNFKRVNSLLKSRSGGRRSLERLSHTGNSEYVCTVLDGPNPRRHTPRPRSFPQPRVVPLRSRIFELQQCDARDDVSRLSTITTRALVP